MGVWPSMKASSLLAILLADGFVIARSKGSHRWLESTDGRRLTFSFHDGEEVGPKMMSKVCKAAGITAERFSKLR